MILYTEPLCIPHGIDHRWEPSQSGAPDFHWCPRCRVVRYTRSLRVNAASTLAHVSYNIPEGPSKWKR